MNNKSNTKIGIISISVGSIILGSIGIFVRMVDKGLSPISQTLGRIFIAFLLVTLLNLLRKKLKKETFSINKKDLPLFFLNGFIGISIMAAAFTLSILYTSISNTYFLLYTAPIFAAIFSSLFLKEKTKSYIFVSIFFSFIGLFFLFDPSNMTKNFAGNIFGLITGICFGAYFVITGLLGKKYSSATITFWSQLFGSIGLVFVMFLIDIPRGLSLNFTMDNFPPILYAGIAVLFGYYLLNFGLTKINASAGSILSLFEPLSSVIYGVIFFTEFPGLNTFVGAAFILMSISYLSFKQYKDSLKAPV